MPLLKDGAVVDDVWAFVADGAELSPGGCITVSLGRFLSEHEILLHRNRIVGVRLQPSDDPLLLAPFIDQLHLIEVAFPRYTDGRGYSIAQLLRRRLGYKGELRAIGHVLRDQLGFMVRTGFDAMLIERGDAEEVLRAATAEFSEHYQSAADGRRTVFEKRHGKAVD
jgi:uncharacterized protein (DUF934 family)